MNSLELLESRVRFGVCQNAVCRQFAVVEGVFAPRPLAGDRLGGEPE